ncbi:hypothetical protein SORBI_3008G180000 [Sorghum bicolor]|uniref:Uncharacterized protein n=1 Tax=Sorghum bicolor TaxID=4558 RepID=A0A1Z5R7J6_SORBI|nr:hypothetical protein SORBI_3008G180000 [Sorghum bicolor]
MVAVAGTLPRADPDPILDGASRVLQQGASGAWCAPCQTGSGGGPFSPGGAPIALGRMGHLWRPGGFIQREWCFSKSILQEQEQPHKKWIHSSVDLVVFCF